MRARIVSILFLRDLTSTPEIPQIPMSPLDPVELPRSRYTVISVRDLVTVRSMNNQVKKIADYEIQYFRKIYIHVTPPCTVGKFHVSKDDRGTYL